MNKKSGISLLSLIVCIVIIIILSGVAIINLFNHDTISDAQKTAFLDDAQAYNDELTLNISNEELKDPLMFDQDEHDYVGEEMLKYIPSMKKEHISKFRIVDGELKFFDNEDENKNIWADEIGILDFDLDFNYTQTETSIAVNVFSIGTKMDAKYIYCLNGAEMTEYISDTSYTFNNLRTGTRYRVTVIAEYENGRVLIEEKYIKTSGIYDSGMTNFKCTPIDDNNVFLNTDVTVEIYHLNIPSGYRLQYSYTGESNDWEDYNYPLVIKENKTIFGRIWNNEDDAKSTATRQIDLIDKKAPIISSVSIKDIKTDGFTIEVVAEDEKATETNACSGIKEYKYYINDILYATSEENTCIVTGQEPNSTYSYYVDVIDKAENIATNESKNVNSLDKIYTITYDVNGGTGTIASQTKSHGVAIEMTTSKPTKSGYTFLGWSASKTATTATYTDANNKISVNEDTTLYAVWKVNNKVPSTPSISLSSRNTNSITVKTSATDADGEKLTYNLYVKGENESKYTLAKTTSNVASGTSTTLQASGLSTYTVYDCYITVTDGKDTAQSSVLTTGTGCSGTGYTCTSGYVNRCPGGSSYTCTSGSSYTCSGGSSTTCYSATQALCGVYASTSTVNYTFSCGHVGTKYNYRCDRCGSTTSITKGPGSCSRCNVNGSAPIWHYSSAYTCSLHGYSGYSPTHTVSSSCTHGYTSSHTVSSPCSHGYTSSHTATSSCTHGYTSSHVISNNPCSHGYTSSHSYCSHDKTSTHYPN